MTAPARVRQADITRLIKGARAAGAHTFRIEVKPDGTICIECSDLDQEKSRKAMGWGWEDA